MSFKSVKRAGGGDCFVVALENVMADRNLYLCHGIVHGQGPLLGLVYPHAWNETDDGYVIDQSNGNDIYMPKDEYYSIGKIDESTVKRYDFYEAARKAVDTGVYGPWDSLLDFEYREAGRMKRKRKASRKTARANFNDIFSKLMNDTAFDKWETVIYPWSYDGEGDGGMTFDEFKRSNEYQDDDAWPEPYGSIDFEKTWRLNGDYTDVTVTVAGYLFFESGKVFIENGDLSASIYDTYSGNTFEFSTESLKKALQYNNDYGVGAKYWYDPTADGAVMDAIFDDNGLIYDMVDGIIERMDYAETMSVQRGASKKTASTFELARQLFVSLVKMTCPYVEYAIQNDGYTVEMLDAINDADAVAKFLEKYPQAVVYDEPIDISNKWARKADYDVAQKAWEIVERMSLVYEDMYDNKWMNQEDVENGDKLLRALSGSDILNNILQERGDIISSDREVAAFWIAFNGVMDHMGEHLIKKESKRTKKAFEGEIELVIDGEYCDGYVYLSRDSDRGVITCDTEVECWGDNGNDTVETYFECPDDWNAVDIAYDIAQQVEFEYGADLGIDMARFTNTIATELQYIMKESKRKARIVMTAKQRAEKLARRAAKRMKRAFIEWQPVSGGYGLYEYDDGEYLFMMQEPDSAWGETTYILDVFDSNNPNKQIVDTEEFDSKEDLENFIIERRFGSRQAAMTRDDILDAIAMFAQSQGSYGRMLEALEEMREYDPDRYEAIMSAWEAEGFNDVVDFVMYIEGSRKARRNTKRASKKTAYAEVPVNSANSSDFDYLYSQSALTWEGMSSDKGNLDAIFEAFQDAGAEPKNSLRFYEITGQAMNEHYGLTGSNAYPDDLTILSIPLEDFDKGSALVMWRMQVGARWFDDVVDNNERREMGW